MQMGHPRQPGHSPSHVPADDCRLVTNARPRTLRSADTRTLFIGQIEPSVQLDFESGTICRRTSSSRTCHTAVSDSSWRHFFWL